MMQDVPLDCAQSCSLQVGSSAVLPAAGGPTGEGDEPGQVVQYSLPGVGSQLPQCGRRGGKARTDQVGKRCAGPQNMDSVQIPTRQKRLQRGARDDQCPDRDALPGTGFET